MSPSLPEPGELEFEYDGIKMFDLPAGIIIKDGRPFLGLFRRRSTFHTAPMANMGRELFVVVESDLKGLFSKSVHLLLKDSKNNAVKIQVPVSAIAPGFERATGEFLAWAKMCSPIIQPPGLDFVVVPKFFFAWNTNL
jgi:hypothetical protein